MKIILFEQSKDLPAIMHISSVRHISDLVKIGETDRITTHPVDIGPVELLLISNANQDGAPNRIVNGRMIHGPFILCGRSKARGPVDIPSEYTHWLRHVYRWEQAKAI